MSYMTSETPLDSMSWKYGNNYLKNAGDFAGFTYTNNHTHLHKYQGKWYVLYHTEMLQDDMNMADGGFRSIQVAEINVDEDNAHIYPATIDKQGVSQIHPLNPYVLQQAETAAATEGIKFVESDIVGNMIATSGNAFIKERMPEQSVILVRKADFGKQSKRLEALLKGEGTLEVRIDSLDSQVVASITSRASDDWSILKSKCRISGTHDLLFTIKGNLQFDSWQFKK